MKAADTYLDLECELFLVLPSRQDCSPPKAECYLQDTVAPGLTDYGPLEENLFLTFLCGLAHLDHRQDPGYLK